MLVLLTTVIVDCTVEPNETLVAPRKFVPVNVTVVVPRTAYGVGLIAVSVGTPRAVKVNAFDALPTLLVKTTFDAASCVKPEGTVNVTEVFVALVTVAEMPPTVTVGFDALGFMPVPVMVMESFALPADAESEVSDGVAQTVNVTVAFEVTSLTTVTACALPVVVPEAITPVIVVEFTTVKLVTFVPPTAALVAPVKFEPVIVMVSPILPSAPEPSVVFTTLVTAGAGLTVTVALPVPLLKPVVSVGVKVML